MGAGLLLLLHLTKALFFVALGQAPLYHDSLAYWTLASQFGAGDVLLPTDASMHRPPAYPLYLIPLQSWFGTRALVAAAAGQQLMTVVTTVLVAWLCWRLTGARLGVLMALGLQLFSIQRHYLAQQMLSDTLLCLLLTVLIVVLTEWLRRPSTVTATAIGVVLGLSILTKPAVQLLWVPIVAIVTWHRWRAGPSEHAPARARVVSSLRHALPMALGVMVLVSPWLVRNRIVFGEVFVAKFDGRVLWGSVFDRGAADLPFSQAPATRQALNAISETGVDPRNAFGVHRALSSTDYTAAEAETLMATAAKEAIRRNSLRFARSVCVRFLEFWTATRGAGTWRDAHWARDEMGTYLDQQSWEWSAAVRFHDKGWQPHALLNTGRAVAALVGGLVMFAFAQWRVPALVLALPALYMATVVALTVVPLSRFHMAIEPMLLVLIVVGTMSLVQALARSRNDA